MMDNDQLRAALNASPAPRITEEYMHSRIVDTQYINLSGTVTICQITLDNRYSVRGESACVNPANYNKDIGEKIAFDQAFNKLWPLFGFLLAEDNFKKPTYMVNPGQTVTDGMTASPINATIVAAPQVGNRTMSPEQTSDYLEPAGLQPNFTPAAPLIVSDPGFADPNKNQILKIVPVLDDPHAGEFSAQKQAIAEISTNTPVEPIVK